MLKSLAKDYNTLVKLPALSDKIVLMPKSDRYYIPNPDYKEFWEAFYLFLRKNFEMRQPIDGEVEESIEPYFGNFGFSYGAFTDTPKYFNRGLDILAKPKTKVYSIFDGELEYSGFGHINGKYVFLSHPKMETEDGFVMNSLYMHLRNFFVSFGSYQKMLRKISFNKYPTVDIKKGDNIGEVGSTGNAEGIRAYLHLQVEFRDDSGKIVLIDPAEVLGLGRKENITRDINTKEEFKSLFEKDKDKIKKSGINKYWKHD